MPITFFATRYMPEGLHPVVITAGDSGMEGSMFLSFMISMAGMTLLLVALLRADVARGAPQGRDRRPQDPYRRLTT